MLHAYMLVIGLVLFGLAVCFAAAWWERPFLLGLKRKPCDAIEAEFVWGVQRCRKQTHRRSKYAGETYSDCGRHG